MVGFERNGVCDAKNCGHVPGCHERARQLAVDHCARYGKVVKFLGVQPNYGGYVSFACRWVPYGAAERPLRTLY